jgi:GNAT superfamily N-acetyltransferase
MILRLAKINEQDIIWEILQCAIAQRKKDGSDQWQNGYPNLQTIVNDINNGNGYVLVEDEIIIAYAAIIFGKEQAYEDLKEGWLSEDDYVVVHRVATAENFKGKGLATQLFYLIEDLSVNNNTFSIKVDTNFDNVPMLKILEKLKYTYCGEIFFNGASRLAYQKILKK